MSVRLQLKEQVKAQLEGHPVATTRVATFAQRVGAHRVNRRLLSGADIVSVTPPYNAARPLTLARSHGRDQIATALVTHGWLGFERPVPDVFATLVRARGGLVLDVGANVGFYALLATSVDPHVEVHAFEPYPPVIELLRSNLALNGGSDRVRVFEQAIGREPGRALLHIPADPHGYVETSASLNPDFRLGGTASAVSVQVTTLDAHIASAGRRRRVGVVKVDVESLEHEVLAGATAIIEQDRPSVFVEVLPVSAIDELETLRAAGRFVDVRLRPTEAVVGGAIGFDDQAWNHLFVPVERVEAELDLVRSCGLEVQG